ncbi:MAG: GNAT family N-acetyltransferase [Saprospiraceae bacterium]
MTKVFIPNSSFYAKPANQQDIPRIKAIIFSVLEDYGLLPDDPSLDYDLDDIELHYKNGYFGLICNAEDLIVGTFALYRMNAELAEIRKMYLLPETRRQGLGTWMIDFLIHQARALGFKRLELDTASVLVEAMKLYEKVGFQAMPAKKEGFRCNRAYFLKI